MSLWSLLVGRPLRSEEQEAERIGAVRAVPVLGLDALASAAYGPEAALTVLLGVGVASGRYIVPISAVIIALLLIVAFSYRQTIAAYPDGGGSYTVASENLGPLAGLVAASALALDYILNVAVAISAGVGAVVSALPSLEAYTLPLCLGLLLLLAVTNLRGVRESGLLFMFPTYAFVLLLGAAIAIGMARAFLAGGHPTPVTPPPVAPRPVEAVGLWLLLRAFASGCTAMTGIEAVSNGVPLFKEPRVARARRTLGAIVLILAALLGGIAYLCHAYRIGATPPGQTGFQSVLSQLLAAVVGRGAFYYAGIAAVFAVLCLSANTSFAGFPRLCRVLALDEYLPPEFAHLGRRLVYSTGIVALTVLAGLLLLIFGGITDRLIPLFAVGAFLAFTMSQLGMVAHWRRSREARHARRSMIINAVGATATAATLVVILVAKFLEGAWLTALVVPSLLGLCLLIRRNYDRIGDETDVSGPLQLDSPPPPVVVIPLKRLDRVARKSIRLAISMSPDVHVVQVRAEEPDMEDLRVDWHRAVEDPVVRAGYTPPRLVVLRSSYREFFGPLIDYVRQLARANPGRYVAVVVPEVVERRWYHFLLHSHRPALLKALLFLRGGPHVIVINAPWYLRDEADEAAAVGDTRSGPRVG